MPCYYSDVTSFGGVTINATFELTEKPPNLSFWADMEDCGHAAGGLRTIVLSSADNTFASGGSLRWKMLTILCRQASPKMIGPRKHGGLGPVSLR
jgi:hypothetical protein